MKNGKMTKKNEFLFRTFESNLINHSGVKIHKLAEIITNWPIYGKLWPWPLKNFGNSDYSGDDQ